MAPEVEIEKYKNTYKNGWDYIREQRYKKMVAIGLIDTNKTKFSKRWNDSLQWQDNPDTAWDARAMAVHAAMVTRMDEGIGRIINTLKQTNQLNNTLIIFLSDNGASAENAAAYGPGFDRPAETRDGKKINYAIKKEVMPGPETTYSCIGPRWANVANTPYQYWKEESYEGGIHTPFIAFWPGGIKALKGGFVNPVCHIMDIMPTFIQLAKTSYPETYNGHVIKPEQGLSFVSVLQGKSVQVHEELCNEHYGAKYIRYEGWKLVARKNEPWHLYKIDEDATEQFDVAARYPEKVKQLENLWNDWAIKNNVLPKKK